MYKLQSIAIMAGLVGLFALFAFALLGWVGVLLVVGAGILLNGLLFRRTAGLILRMHRARPQSRWEALQLHRVGAELAQRAGIARPELLVYPADMPNAFAIGAGRGVVALSTGLLRLLDLRELRGVLAHEFAHLKNRDSALSLSAGVFVEAIGGLSQLVWVLALVSLFFGGGGVLVAGGWGLLVLVGLAPLGAGLLQAGLLRTRERMADLDAAEMSGDPRGLASALHKLGEYGKYVRGVMRRLRFIYTSEGEVEGEAGWMRWWRSHPGTEERVRALLEMEAAWAARQWKVAV